MMKQNNKAKQNFENARKIMTDVHIQDLLQTLINTTTQLNNETYTQYHNPTLTENLQKEIIHLQHKIMKLNNETQEDIQNEEIRLLKKWGMANNTQRRA